MAETKDRIVEAAAELFRRRGYAATGLKQISKESGAQLGSVYHFFPGGKAHLAGETLRAAGKAYQTLVEAVFDRAGDVVAGVRDVFAGAAELLEHTDYADACPIATVALEVASTNDALRAVTAEIFEGWIESGSVRLRDAGVPAARARELSILLIGAIEGALLLARTAKTTEALEVIGRFMVGVVEEAVANARADSGADGPPAPAPVW